MNRELAKELKLAGFPVEPLHAGCRFYPNESDAEWTDAARKEGIILSAADLQHRIEAVRNGYYCPTLADLIAACGKNFGRLTPVKAIWRAETADAALVAMGNSPEEAVGKLWLASRKIKAATTASSTA